jgi:Cdc6-like AAA superfamily ATPase
MTSVGIRVLPVLPNSTSVVKNTNIARIPAEVSRVNEGQTPTRVDQVAQVAHRTLFPEVNGFTLKGAWYSVTDCFSAPSALGRKLREYASQQTLNVNDEVIQTLVDSFQSPKFPQLNFFFKKVFNRLNAEQMNTVMEQLFLANAERDPQALMKKMMGLFTLEKVEWVIKNNFPLYKNVKTEAEAISGFVSVEHEAQVRERRDTFISMVKVYVINLVEWVIDNLMAAFALNGIGDEFEDFEAMMRLSSLMTLWGTLNTWLVSLNVLLGSVALTATVVSCAAFAITAGAIIYFKWIKPCPDTCSPCINYTTEARKGNIEPVLGRDEEIDAVIAALCSNNKGTRTHPMLVGPSGSGKTEIVKGLALRIATGQVPEKLKNKKVFFVNTSELVGTEKRSNDPLSKIQKRFRGYEQDVIIFFDEVHAAWKGKEHNPSVGALGEKLKSVFDPSPGSFPYCIGATTKDEYDQYISGNWAFERRLEMIPVAATDKEATTLILNNMINREAPDLPIDDDVVGKIYDLCKKHFPKHATPQKPKSILAKAFGKLRARQNSHIAKALQDLKYKSSSLTCTFNRLKGTDRMFYRSPKAIQLKQSLDDVNAQIQQKEKELEIETKKYEAYEKMKIKREELMSSIQQLAMKIANEKVKTPMLFNFILKHNYFLPALESALEAKQQEFHDSVVKIDLPLIEQIISEELVGAAKLESLKKPKA